MEGWVRASYASGRRRRYRERGYERAAFPGERRKSRVGARHRPSPTRASDGKGRVGRGGCYQGRPRNPLPGRRRRGLPPVAHTALARPEQAVDDERRRELAPHAGGEGGGGARAPLRLVGRGVFAGAEGPGGGGGVGEGRGTDLVLCSPKGRGRAPVRPLRGGEPGDPGGSDASRARLQEGGGAGHPASLRGTVLPELLREAGADKPYTSDKGPPLAGGPLLRRRGGVPVGAHKRRSRRVQLGSGACSGRPGDRTHPQRYPGTGLGLSCPRGGGSLVADRAAAGAGRVAGPLAQRPDNGHYPRPRGAWLDARARR